MTSILCLSHIALVLLASRSDVKETQGEPEPAPAPTVPCNGGVWSCACKQHKDFRDNIIKAENARLEIKRASRLAKKKRP